MLRTDQQRLLHHCLDSPLDTARWYPYADSLLDDERYQDHAVMLQQIINKVNPEHKLCDPNFTWGIIQYEKEEEWIRWTGSVTVHVSRKLNRQPFVWTLPMGGLPKIQWYRGACPNLNNANRRLLKALLVHRRYVSKTRYCLCRLWDSEKMAFREMEE